LYNYWNYNRTGKFHFTSIQSFNAIYYYRHYYTSKEGEAAGKKFIQSERVVLAQLPTFKERYEYAHTRGIILLKENAGPYLLYHLKKSILLLVEPGKGELDLFTGRLTLGNLYAAKTTSFKNVVKTGSAGKIIDYTWQNPTAIIAILITCFNLVKLVGLLLLIIYAGMPKIVKWFIVLFIAYFALITGPIANAHYLMPVSLIISGCGVIGLAAIKVRNYNI